MTDAQQPATTDTTTTEQNQQTQTPDVTQENNQANIEANPGGEQQQKQDTENPETKTEETNKTEVNIPESADGYEVAIDGFDLEAFSSIESNKAFLEKAHSLGVSNEQMNAVLEAFVEHNTVQIEQLQEEWGTAFEGNINLAKQAIEAAGLSMDEVDSPTFGIKLAAYYGKHLQEDLPPSNTQPNGAIDPKELMKSEAYMDDSHPDHARVHAEVAAAYQKQYK